MLDEYKLDQPIVYKTLVNAVKKNRNSHAYLFETKGYEGAFNLVLSFVKYILCPNNYTNYEKCQNCMLCKDIDDNNNIELKIIKPDGIWIKKEQLLDLQQEFSKKAITGNKKIYIITEADKLNPAASNSILKFLEEPEENIIAILLVENKYQLLDTIVSRCQIISLFNKSISTDENTLNKLKKIVSCELDEEKIQKVIDFVQFYEKNGIDALLNTQKMWHQHFKEKNILIDAFEIMILYYMDAINLECGYHLSFFEDYKTNLEQIIKKNNLNNLTHKVNVLLKNKDYIRYNVNTNLLVDKLILELEEGKNG